MSTDVARRLKTDLPDLVGDEGPLGDYVLAVESLTKTFDNNQSLYRNIDLRVRPGEILVIVGESGIGKSVLLKHLIGLMDPTAGHVWYCLNRPDRQPIDVPVHRLPEDAMAQIRLDVGMVFQESSLFDWMTVAENIGLPLDEHHDRVLDLVEDFRTNLGLFLRILDAPSTPPACYREVREALSKDREALETALSELTDRVQDDPDTLREFAWAAGLDRARERGFMTEITGGVRGDQGVRSRIQEILAEPMILGQIIDPVPSDCLHESLKEFKAGFRQERDRILEAYQAVRKRWATDDGDLTALVIDWARRDGLETSSLEEALGRWFEKRGAPDQMEPGERHAEFLRSLKNRPLLLLELVDGDTRPAGLEDFLDSARLAGGALAKLCLESLDGLPEEELAKAYLLGWMITHPIETDRRQEPAALARSILGSFRGRAQEIAGILARLPGADWSPVLQGLREAYSGLVSRQETALERMEADISRPDLIEATIELIVNGLMETFRLVVDRDRSKLPSELSGGMKKRVGMARSLALMPRVVLYDEPTAGLDPILAKSIAREILKLQTAGVVTTSVVVTHDKELYHTLKAGGLTRLAYISGGILYDQKGEVLLERIRFDQDADPPPEPSGVPLPSDTQPRDFVREFEPELGSR